MATVLIVACAPLANDAWATCTYILWMVMNVDGDFMPFTKKINSIFLAAGQIFQAFAAMPDSAEIRFQQIVLYGIFGTNFFYSNHKNILFA